jgi:hypothetical protein
MILAAEVTALAALPASIAAVLALPAPFIAAPARIADVPGAPALEVLGAMTIVCPMAIFFVAP